VRRGGRGAPLAALNTVLTLSVCKRRDAVRLAATQPARPAGAESGLASASTVSWAAPKLNSFQVRPTLAVRRLGPP